MQRSTRKLVAGSAVLGLAVGSLLWHAPPASAEPECLTSSSDFDHDGTPDIAIGIPGGSGRDGAVQVRLSNEDDPITTTLSGPPGFGTAVTSLSSYAGEGDDDLCSQLVVGSPDESDRTDLTRSGSVYVYYWNAQISRFALRGTFHPRAQGVKGTDQSGARFGAALAAEQRPADGFDPRPGRLYVGAPGFDLHGVRDAGRVTSFWLDNGEDPIAHDTQLLDYGAEYMPGPPRTGAALGSSLTVGGGLVAAGVPGQTIRGMVGAGAVLVERYDSNPDDFVPQERSQDDPGVPGAPEKGDRFGAAVHLVDQDGQPPTLLVGAPGEDLGRIADAGTVTIARISPTDGHLVGTVRVVDQNSAGMAGTAEAGDAFGSAVSSMPYGSRQAFLVGSPGEDVGRAHDAGMVQTIGNGAGWTQNTRGVPGNAETGDRMGASLGGSVATGARQPLIGVPGENDSAGAVIVGLPVDDFTVDYLRGTRAGNRYGFVVGP